MQYRTTAFITFALFALTTAACTGGDSGAGNGMADTTGMGLAAANFQRQRAFADSFMTAVKPVDSVAAELGAIYSVADDSLARIVRRESAKTYDCYTNVLNGTDPQLTGVVHMLVNFGAAGWDLVRPERWQWSSEAGNIVTSCLSARAKSEWTLPTRGIRPGAHLVTLTFRPDSGGAARGSGGR